MLQNTFPAQADEQKKDTNLIDLFIFLLKYKWLILSFILLAGIGTPLCLYIFTPSTFSPKVIQKVYYYSECAISPYNIPEVNIIKMILQSRDLTLLEAKENRLPMIRQNLVPPPIHALSHCG